MGQVRRKVNRVLAAGIVATTLLPSVLRGQAAAAKPEKFLTASVASLDSLAKAAADIGVELPPFLTPAGIETSFAFLGAGSINPQRPIGVVYFMAPTFEVSKGNGIVFVLPVKDGTAPLDPLRQGGGKPVDGRNDVVALNGAAFRRTQRTMMFATDPSTVLLSKESDLTGLYPDPELPPPAGPQTLARVSFDLEAFLRGSGKSLEDIIKANVDNAAAPADPVGRAQYEMGQKLAIGWIQSVHRAGLTLSRNGPQFGLQVSVAPVTVTPAAKFNRAGMPADVLARMDLAFCPIKSMTWLDGLVENFGKTLAQDKRLNLGPAEQRASVRFLHSVAELLFGGDGESIGVAMANGKPVVYVVEKRTQPVDAAARLKQLAAEFAGATGPKNPSSIDVQQYTDARGNRVTRLRELESGAPSIHLDGFSKGDTLYLTVAADAAHHMTSLLDQPAGAPVTGLGDGSINLEQVFSKAVESGALGQLAEQQRATIFNLVKGHRLDLAATKEGDSVVIGLSLPQKFIRDAIELITKGPNQGAP